MTEHLLLVSIGPVQDFIAAARRCQDLWFGSFLLSELAGKLAEGIAKQGAMLIFPGTKGAQTGRDKPSVANKVVVSLPAHLSPADAVRFGRESMNHWLETLRESAFTRCAEAVRKWQDTAGSVFYRDIAEAQVADLIDIQWVAVPFTRNHYAEAHAQAERLLSWRKNTRDFGKVPWRARGVPKSSIDGQRESVIDERFFDRVRNEVQLGSKYQLGTNERLCGVGILKRFGLETIEEDTKFVLSTRRPIFHSNSHVAAGPLLTYVSRLGERGLEAFHAYAQTLHSLGIQLKDFKVRTAESDMAELTPRTTSGMPTGSEKLLQRRVFPRGGQVGSDHGLDGYLLYRDRLRPILEENSTVPENEQVDRLSTAQNTLRKFYESIKASEPSSYYVILAADGDRMGAAIRTLATRSEPIQQHQELSAALARFASRAREIIEHDHAGSLIYSGGDDVLALLPLHTALFCARALQADFTAALADVCGSLASPPTLSVGLAVVHHLQHMSVSRALAQAAERLAKRERNSLAILVDKRSGGTLSVSGKWNEEPMPLDARIAVWCELFDSDKLPDGIAFELETLLAPFEVQDLATDAAVPQRPQSEMIASLVRRVIARKRSRGGTAALDSETDRLLNQCLAQSKDPIQAVRGLAAELQIAREFLRAYQIAWKGLPT